MAEDRLVTHGGRVLGVTALGRDMAQARERAYEGVSRITSRARSAARTLV
jgi:phosphoribosylamine--glycine ligase